MGIYDVAQICLNGHIVESSLTLYPEGHEKFCHLCGAKTIAGCPKCKTGIRGDYYEDSYARDELGTSIGIYEVPSFCYNCGKQFPWTESKIRAAHDLAQELENLSKEDKEIMQKSIDDIVMDTTQTELAAIRFKKILLKAGKTGVGAFRSIITDIASETAKKIILGP